MGIKNNMKVLKLNNLDFDQGNDFCGYLEYIKQDLDTLSIELLDQDNNILNLNMVNEALSEKNN